MSLKKYLTEAELAAVQPVTGDEFDISIRDLTNIETFVLEHTEGSITIALDEKAIQMLESCGCTFEDEDEDESEKKQVDELAPVIGAVGGALARGAGALAKGAAKAVVGSGIKAAADKLDKTLFGPKPNEADYEESINDIRRLSGMAPKETVKEENYDTSPGSPYDRGAADAYYGRKSRPHKIAPYTGPDAVKGQMQLLPLTDPAEIAAYEAGYREAEFGEKDYGESVMPEGIEDWNMGVTSIPRTEPFKLSKIVVTSKHGKTYTFDTEQEAKQHFGSNWDSKINNPEWRTANGWKLDMNNTKLEKGLDESKITRESAELVAQLIIENKLADFLPPFSANGLWVSDRRGDNVLEVTRHGAIAQEVANALNKHLSKNEKSNESLSGKGTWVHGAVGLAKSIGILLGIPVYSVGAVMGFIGDKGLEVVEKTPLGQAIIQKAKEGDPAAARDLKVVDQELKKIGVQLTPDSLKNLEAISDKYLHEGKLNENTEYQSLKSSLLEAEYQGRKVPLGKPMQGDVAKFKVYVKDPKTGNVKKVNFGDKTMRIKKSNPERRKSFRARHNCDNPGPRTKARYWSCRKW